MKLILRLITLPLLTLTFITCTESDLILEEVGVGGTTDSSGTTNDIKQYNSVTSLGGNNQIMVRLSFENDGDALEAYSYSNLELPIVGQTQIESTTTYTRDSQNRIISYNTQASISGVSSSSVYNITYDVDGNISQIEEIIEGVSRISTFSLNGTTITGEQRNSSDEVIGRLTISDFSTSTFPSEIIYEHPESNTIYKDSLIVESSNLKELYFLKDGNISTTTTFEYDTNTNPLSFEKINSYDITMGILQAFAATDFTDGDPFLSEISSGIQVYSANNNLSFTESGVVNTLTYVYSTDNYPVSASNSGAESSITNTYTYH